MRNLVCAGLIELALAVGGVAAEIEPASAGNRPLRIIKHHAEFKFPAKMLAARITSGEVRLFLSVDAEGQLVDHLFVAFTHHEFANEVSRTVARWRFEPTQVDGRAIGSTVLLKVRFETAGVVVMERHGMDDPPATRHAFVFRARGLRELDEVPRLLLSVPPVNPAAADEPAITGRARVEFYIDENGNVRMPIVKETDDERLGWAALAAVAKWQFEVPRRGGHPVVARASQVFVFRPEE